MKRYLLYILLICIMLHSCNDNKVTAVVSTTNQKNNTAKEDSFIQGNKNIVMLESEEIDLFVKRYEWKVVQMGTGLRMETVNKTSGIMPKEGNSISLKYKTMLLTGEVVYSSDELGEKSFVVDKSSEISSLHEAVKKMRVGEKARLVIPSHLAYGVAGDGNLIKGYTPIAMYVELTDIK